MTDWIDAGNGVKITGAVQAGIILPAALLSTTAAVGTRTGMRLDYQCPNAVKIAEEQATLASRTFDAVCGSAQQLSLASPQVLMLAFLLIYATPEERQKIAADLAAQKNA